MDSDSKTSSTASSVFLLSLSIFIFYFLYIQEENESFIPIIERNVRILYVVRVKPKTLTHTQVVKKRKKRNLLGCVPRGRDCFIKDRIVDHLNYLVWDGIQDSCNCSINIPWVVSSLFFGAWAIGCEAVKYLLAQKE